MFQWIYIIPYVIFNQFNYPFRMYYIVYPTYLTQNHQTWILPNAQIIQNEQPKVSEQISRFCRQPISPPVLVKQSEQSLKQTFFEPQIKNIQKLSLKQTKAPKDDDYIPEICISKKSKKSQQLQNRNIVPNIVRLILSFIQKKGKSSIIVEKLLKKQNIQKGWNTKRFYLYQSMIRGKMNNYVNEETLKELVKMHPEQSQLYSQAEQLFYARVTRTVIDYFLRAEISVCILASKRMDSTKKTHHLNALRNIRQTLRTLVTQ